MGRAGDGQICGHTGPGREVETGSNIMWAAWSAQIQATQSCISDFAGIALSNPIWAAAHYPGEGEFIPLALYCAAASPNLRLQGRPVWIAL